MYPYHLQLLFFLQLSSSSEPECTEFQTLTTSSNTECIIKYYESSFIENPSPSILLIQSFNGLPCPNKGAIQIYEPDFQSSPQTLTKHTEIHPVNSGYSFSLLRCYTPLSAFFLVRPPRVRSVHNFPPFFIHLSVLY